MARCWQPCTPNGVLLGAKKAMLVFVHYTCAAEWMVPGDLLEMEIKEIDVIREVPVLIFKEIGLQETRVEKAKKLMKAFTKGYLDENGLLQVMAKEEIIDEE